MGIQNQVRGSDEESQRFRLTCNKPEYATQPPGLRLPGYTLPGILSNPFKCIALEGVDLADAGINMK